MARISKADHPRILHLVDVERRKVAEVAAEHGCTPANIYALLARLRRTAASDGAGATEGSAGATGDGAGGARDGAERPVGGPPPDRPTEAVEVVAPSPVEGPADDLFAPAAVLPGAGGGRVGGSGDARAAPAVPAGSDGAGAPGDGDVSGSVAEDAAAPRTPQAGRVGPPRGRPAPSGRAPAPVPASAAEGSRRKPAPERAGGIGAKGVGASLARPGFGLVLRTADGEESLTPFRSLDDLLSAVKPILRSAARSHDPVWFSIQPVDLASIETDVA